MNLFFFCTAVLGIFQFKQPIKSDDAMNDEINDRTGKKKKVKSKVSEQKQPLDGTRSTYQMGFPQVLAPKHQGFHYQHTGNTCQSNQHQQNLDPHLQSRTEASQQDTAAEGNNSLYQLCAFTCYYVNSLQFQHTSTKPILLYIYIQICVHKGT